MSDRQRIENHTPWMLTFADLLSLILTFFILIFSMSTLDFNKWEEVVDTMKREFNELYAQSMQQPGVGHTNIRVPKWSGQNMKYLEALVSRQVSGTEVFKAAQVNTIGNKVVLSVPAEAFFDRKNINLTLEGEEAIAALTGMLVQLENRIVVAGHSDRGAVIGGRLRSNWDLSMARARIVAGIIVEKGYRKKIIVQGFADSRFHEIDQELSMADRYKLAERIDIIILDEKRNKGPYEIF